MHTGSVESTLCIQASSNPSLAIPIGLDNPNRYMTSLVQEANKFLTKDILDQYADILAQEALIREHKKQFVAQTFKDIKPQLQQLVDNFMDTHPEEFI